MMSVPILIKKTQYAGLFVVYRHHKSDDKSDLYTSVLTFEHGLKMIAKDKLLKLLPRVENGSRSNCRASP